MTYIVSSTLSMLSLPCICCIASPARSIAASVSLLIFAASMEYICCSRVEICAVVCSRVCSCCFLRFRAALAAVADRVSQITPNISKASSLPVIKTTEGCQSRADIPFLFVLTFFLAIVSCSSIWFCKCRSLFCSISNCDRKPRIAFLGVSFLFWVLCPPNQPHTPDILYCICWPERFEIDGPPSPKMFSRLGQRSLRCSQGVTVENLSQGLAIGWLVIDSGVGQSESCNKDNGKWISKRIAGRREWI
jgi:hypothetical protein